MRFKSLCIVLLFISCNTLFALNTEPENVFVFVSVDSIRPNSSTINLYQDTQSSLRMGYSDRFRVLPVNEGLSYIKSTSIDTLNSVLYIDRSEFLSSKDDKKSIETFQYIMETRAIDNIFVIDCVPESNGYVSSCGIYVYNRLKKGFLIAVEKKFTAPILDTSSWGQILVDRLITNIENYKKDKTQEKLDRLLIESQEETAPLYAQLSGGIKYFRKYIQNLYGGSFSIISYLKESRDFEDSSELQSDSIKVLSSMFGGLELGYYFGKESSTQKFSWDFDTNLILGERFRFSHFNILLEGTLGYSIFKAGIDRPERESIGLVQKSLVLGGGVIFQKQIQDVMFSAGPRFEKFIDLKRNTSFVKLKVGYLSSINVSVSWKI